jgi:hypothetical protein
MRADRLNRVKQAAFGPFVAIMKLKLDLINDPNYTPPSTFIKTYIPISSIPYLISLLLFIIVISNSLFAELTTSKSKMGQTVRGLILSTLGLMCALHTSDMQPYAVKVRIIICHCHYHRLI